jgi:hypothetical protein
MKYTVAIIILLLISCAPRFTVYIDLDTEIPEKNVVILSQDTIDVGSVKEKKVRYVLKRDVVGIERLFLRRKMK